jgi:methionine-rich copper-binding protein CopC
MRALHLFGTALLMAWGSAAQAHAHLEEALPADNSVIHEAPAALVLRFSEQAQLTGLSIEKDGGPKQKLAPPEKSQTRITVPLPVLEPGHYVISWRALSADGHVVPGQIHFTLSQ